MVIGAGIAGQLAAYILAEKGHSVLLAEKEKKTIDKVCGEGLLPFGISHLPKGSLRDAFQDVGYRFKGLSYSNAKKCAQAFFPQGHYGLGLDRAELDEALSILLGSHPRITLERGRKVIEQDLDSFDHILAADGIHSPIGRPNQTKLKVSRMGARFRIHGKVEDHVRVFFGRYYELYLTPTGHDRTSVAALVDSKKLNLKGSEVADFILQRFYRDFPEYKDVICSDMKLRAPIISPHYRNNRMHLLGDAAQAFDPISGSGMSFAIICAQLATEHLHDVPAYWRALRPYRLGIAAFTNLLIALKGGGWLTNVMLRQLSRSPKSFESLLAHYDGKSSPLKIGPRATFELLRP